MQEVSDVYMSPCLYTDERKMALRARNVSGAFEKRAPSPANVHFLQVALDYGTIREVLQGPQFPLSI